MYTNKPTFTDLTPEQQSSFGNGCTCVPDLIFTESCRHHDFNYARGGSIRDKIKADWDFLMYSIGLSSKWYEYLVALVYWAGVSFVPPFCFVAFYSFEWGKYRTLEEILLIDKKSK